MMETLSVIIPVYKVEKYLRQCVDSVIHQTYADLEVLLIDDGSPDNCGKICDEYAAKDNRIRVLHKENGGLCAARNSGIDMATGKYIAFVDSDDWLELDYYEKMMKSIQKYDADLVTSNYYRDVDSHCTMKRAFRKEETTEDRKRILSFQLGTLSLYYCNFKDLGLGPCWNKLFKRTFVLRHHIYFDDITTCEDILYSFKAFRYARRVTCIPASGYHYRYVESSIMNGYKPDRYEQDKNTLKDLYRMGSEQFRKGSVAYTALYAFTIETFRAIVWNIHSPENPESLREKINNVRRIVNSEPYKTALNNFIPKSVAPRFRMCAILKTHSALYLYFLSFLQYWKRKLVGVRKD